MLDHATSTTANPSEVVQRLQSLLARQANSRKPVPVSQPAPIQFLLFKANAEQRCAFNELLASALFNARNRKQRREYKKEASIAVIGNHKITYTGEELRQDDETVWLQLIHLAKESQPGNLVEFKPGSFLKSINWKNDGRSYIRLRSCLTRLQATSLKIYSERLARGVSLSMLPFFEWEDSTTGQALTRYRARFDPALAQLFDGDHYTRIEWQQRLNLTPGLASWLHGYFSRHRTPYPIKLATLSRGAGVTAQSKHLKEMFKPHLDALKDCEFLLDFNIDDDGLVSVIRNNQEEFRMRNQP